jgi:hypothetical protein
MVLVFVISYGSFLTIKCTVFYSLFFNPWIRIRDPDSESVSNKNHQILIQSGSTTLFQVVH